MSSRVKELDRALSGNERPTSDEAAALADLGRQIRDAYLTFTPPHTPERAMFVRAVEDGSGLGWSRFFAPATVTAVLLIGLLFLGRTATPGGTFYPVRQVLRSVGLAPASVDEVQELLDWADRLLDKAEAISDHDPEAGERHAFEAVRVIGMAEGAYADLEIDERPQLTDELAHLLARAKAILTEAPGEDRDRDADGKAVLREDDDDPDDGRDDDDDDGDPSSRDRTKDPSRRDKDREGDNVRGNAQNHDDDDEKTNNGDDVVDGDTGNDGDGDDDERNRQDSDKDDADKDEDKTDEETKDDADLDGEDKGEEEDGEKDDGVGDNLGLKDETRKPADRRGNPPRD